MSGSIKFLLLLVVALIVATGSLWFVGGKQREYSTAVTIDAPISRVYSNLTDLDRAQEWRSEIEQIRALGEGTIEIGSQFEATLQFGGHSDEYLEEVLRLKANELFSIRSTSDRAVLNAVYKLESVDSDHTRLTYKLKMTSRGIHRVLTPFADDTALKETLETNALALKNMVESGVAIQSNATAPANASPDESTSGSADSAADEGGDIDEDESEDEGSEH